jgi:hypothetical protein
MYVDLFSKLFSIQLKSIHKQKKHFLIFIVTFILPKKIFTDFLIIKNKK